MLKMNWSERRRDERVKTEGHLAGSAGRAYDSYLRVVNLSPHWAWSLLEKERKRQKGRKQERKGKDRETSWKAPADIQAGKVKG